MSTNAIVPVTVNGCPMLAEQAPYGLRTLTYGSEAEAAAAARALTARGEHCRVVQVRRTFYLAPK